MTSYTKNVPQPDDNPSESQDQLLQNFQTLNTIYGTSGDHYPWDNANLVENNKHAKVTLPGLPTTNPPGNALPTPAAGNCAIFGQTQAAAVTQTTPFLRRDGLTTDWPLMPIKAFCTFTAVVPGVGPDPQTINQQFNVTSISRTGNTYTVTLTNPMRTSDYGVFFSTTQPNVPIFYFTPNAGDLTKFTMTVALGNGFKGTFTVVEV